MQVDKKKKDEKPLGKLGYLGSMIDGPIAGATIFIDADGTGNLNNNPFVKTDDSGNFLITPNESFPLVGFGGIDTVTKVAYSGKLYAPPGSTVLSAYSTILEKLRGYGFSIDEGHDLLMRLASRTLNLSEDYVDSIKSTPRVFLTQNFYEGSLNGLGEGHDLINVFNNAVELVADTVSSFMGNVKDSGYNIEESKDLYFDKIADKLSNQEFSLPTLSDDIDKEFKNSNKVVVDSIISATIILTSTLAAADISKNSVKSASTILTLQALNKTTKTSLANKLVESAKTEDEVSQKTKLGAVNSDFRYYYEKASDEIAKELEEKLEEKIEDERLKGGVKVEDTVEDKVEDKGEDKGEEVDKGSVQYAIKSIASLTINKATLSKAKTWLVEVEFTDVAIQVDESSVVTGVLENTKDFPATLISTGDSTYTIDFSLTSPVFKSVSVESAYIQFVTFGDMGADPVVTDHVIFSVNPETSYISPSSK